MPLAPAAALVSLGHDFISPEVSAFDRWKAVFPSEVPSLDHVFVCLAATGEFKYWNHFAKDVMFRKCIPCNSCLVSFVLSVSAHPTQAAQRPHRAVFQMPAMEVSIPVNLVSRQPVEPTGGGLFFVCFKSFFWGGFSKGYSPYFAMDALIFFWIEGEAFHSAFNHNLKCIV